MVDVKKDQRDDPVVSQAIEQLTREGCVKTGQLKAVTTHLKLRNGLLYFSERFVVPKNTQGNTLTDVHAAVHFGKARTLQLLRRNFFWNGMARSGKYYVIFALLVNRRSHPTVLGNPLKSLILLG